MNLVVTNIIIKIIVKTSEGISITFRFLLKIYNYFFDTLYLHINNELKLKIQFFNARQKLSVLKLTTLKIIQNEIGFIRLFNRESIEINFQSLHFSPHESSSVGHKMYFSI